MTPTERKILLALAAQFTGRYAIRELGIGDLVEEVRGSDVLSTENTLTPEQREAIIEALCNMGKKV